VLRKPYVLPLPETVVWQDFSAYDALTNPIYGNDNYSKLVRRTAERIAPLCELGAELGDILGGCEQYELPPDPSPEEKELTEQEMPNR
jgi:hypothetical protein